MTFAIALPALLIVFGSIFRCYIGKPKTFTKYVLEHKDTITVAQKREMFCGMFTMMQNFWMVVGVIAAIFSIHSILFFIIGMYLTYIVKIIPEIRRELDIFDGLQLMVDELIEKFILENKETDEKA